MSEHTLKSDHTVVNKKDFHVLDLVGSCRILVLDKFKHSEDGFKHFIGYLHVDDVIRPLCIILSSMCGYIKYFDNGRRNMSFLIEDEDLYLKYRGIWNKIKKLLNVKFHSQPIHDNKYIKTTVNRFGETINTFFSDNKVPKERSHYICIAAISVDSVLKIERKNQPQGYLEQCKYKEKQEN